MEKDSATRLMLLRVVTPVLTAGAIALAIAALLSPWWLYHSDVTSIPELNPGGIIQAPGHHLSELVAPDTFAAAMVVLGSVLLGLGALMVRRTPARVGSWIMIVALVIWGVVLFRGSPAHDVGNDMPTSVEVWRGSVLFGCAWVTALGAVASTPLRRPRGK